MPGLFLLKFVVWSPVTKGVGFTRCEYTLERTLRQGRANRLRSDDLDATGLGAGWVQRALTDWHDAGRALFQPGKMAPETCHRPETPLQ